MTTYAVQTVPATGLVPIAVRELLAPVTVTPPPTTGQLWPRRG